MLMLTVKTKNMILKLLLIALFSCLGDEKADDSINKELPNIIYNDDGLYLFRERLLWEKNILPDGLPTWGFSPVVCEWWKPDAEPKGKKITKYRSVEDFLNFRLQALTNTAVDCVSFFDNWTDYQAHPVLGDSPLSLVAEWGRKNRRSVFLSVRMNDGHHNSHRWNCIDMRKRKFFLSNLDKLIDPVSEAEWNEIYIPWLEHRAELPKSYKSKDLRYNWKHPEIAEHFLNEILEKVEKAQLNGVELDFWRSPKLFPEGQEDPQVITDFIQRLRDKLNSLGQQRQCRIFLIARVPLIQENPVGLSACAPSEWIEKKLLDGIILGQGNYLNRWKKSSLVDLAHKNGVKVYGSYDRMKNKAYYENYGTPDQVRGSASVNYYKGCDGLYFFNYYSPEEYPVLNTLQSLSPYPQEFCTEIATVFDGKGSRIKNVVDYHIPSGEGPIRFVFEPLIIPYDANVGSWEIVVATKNIPAQLLQVKLNDVVLDGMGESYCYNSSDVKHILRGQDVVSNLIKGENKVEVLLKKNPFGCSLVFKYLSIRFHP